MENTNFKQRLTKALAPYFVNETANYPIYTKESIHKTHSLVEFERLQFDADIDFHVIHNSVYVAWIGPEFELETMIWMVI